MALTSSDVSARERHEDITARFLIAQDGPRPTATELDFQKWLREQVATVAQNLNAGVADCREKSLALTHLEEALMWAGKAIFK